MNDSGPLRFYGGDVGALAPFGLFLIGVAWLGLSGAPDERGFWPILLAALVLGLGLARDRTRYAETIITGMSQPIVMLMVMAWILAGVLGAVISAGGFVEALVWITARLSLSAASFVVASFVICAIVSTATGTSLGTILICSPLLYPTGGLMGANVAVLAGAIIGGATFGDNISPVSDTTIASATTQQADIGGVVQSRLKYALTAAAVAMAAYLASGDGATPADAGAAVLAGAPAGLPMLIAPALTIVLLLRRRHLVEGLIAGVVSGIVIGLAFGLLAPAQLLSIDAGAFIATGLILEGMERGIGVSVFTILLMGLVAGLEASGILGRIVEVAARRTRTERGAELWMFAAVSAVVMLTTHSVVAILTVGRFARDTGEMFGIDRYRRANILDVTVCTYPFLLPFFIPTILMASTTGAGVDLGVPRVSAFQVGLYNFHSWALLVVVLVAIVTGWGRRAASTTP